MLYLYGIDCSAKKNMTSLTVCKQSDQNLSLPGCKTKSFFEFARIPSSCIPEVFNNNQVIVSNETNIHVIKPISSTL